jgi:hypothetical protein
VSSIINKITWKITEEDKSFVYALSPTLDLNAVHFQVKGGYRIGENGKSGATTIAEREEVARRLVACWDACEGLSTESLEEEPPIKDQRDHALAALTRLVARHTPFTGHPSHAALVEFWEAEKAQGRGEADDQLFALAAIAACKPAAKADIKTGKASAGHAALGLPEEKKVELAADWFSENWAVTKAVGMLHQYDRALQSGAPVEPAPCTWSQSTDPSMPDTFAATCGVVWTFTEGGPRENGMHFCPGCGAKVAQGGSS